MILEPKTQDFPLTAGLDQSDDPQGSPQGLLQGNNVVWNKDRVLDARGGFVQVSGYDNANQDNMGLVSAGPTLGIVRQDRVVPLPKIGTTAQATTLSPLVEHTSYGLFYGGVRDVSVDQAFITRVNGAQYLCVVTTRVPESPTQSIMTGVSFEVCVQVVDYASGTVIVDQVVSGPAAQFGKVVSINDGTDWTFGIMWVEDTSGGPFTTAELRFRNVNFTTLQLGTTSTLGTRTCSATSDYDFIASSVNNQRAYAAYSSTTAQLGLLLVDAAGTAVAASLGSGGYVAPPVVALVHPTTTGEICVACADAGSVNYVIARFNQTTLVNTTFNYINTVASAPAAVRAFGLALATAATVCTAVVDYRGQNSASIMRAYQVPLTGSGIFPSISGTAVNTHILSRPWIQTVNGSPVVNVLAAATNSLQTEQRTTLVVRVPQTTATPFTTVGQVSFDESGLVDTGSAPYVPLAPLSSTITIGTYQLVATLVDLETGSAESIGFDTPVLRVRVSKLSFDVSRPVVTASLGLSAFLAGSVPVRFDGTQSQLATFVDAPTFSVSPTAAGSLLAGVYGYQVVYEATDVHGQIQVSSPSPLLTTTLTAGQKVTVSGTMGAHIMVSGLVTPRGMRVKIYRTQVNNSVLQLVYTFAAQPGTAWTYVDNIPDSAVALAEVIYTNGNVLESEPAPPVQFIWSHRNRLFGIRSDTPETVAFTKETTDPFIPQWHSVLTLRVDNDGGPPTAGASLADKCVIFQANQINLVSGFGPDSLGSGSFSIPEVAAMGIGVALADRASVCKVPQGIVFRHYTGIQLLTPDLQVVPIGRQVEDFLVGRTIQRARYLPSLHQCWFLLNPNGGTNRVLVWDVRYNRWTTFTVSSFVATEFVDVLEHQGTVYLATRRFLYTYNPAATMDTDNVTPASYDQVIELPWFRVDRAQVMRAQRIHLTGTALSTIATTSQLLVQVFLQNQHSPGQDMVTTPDKSFAWSGAGQLVNVQPGPLALDARCVTQQCQAIRIRLTIQGSSTSRVFLPATLTLDYGVMPSRSQAPSGKRPSAS